MVRRIIRSIVLVAGLCIGAIPQLATAGDALDLEALRGKVVYVDFWASWCVPCRQSFPWMDEMQRSYGHDGFVVVAVNVDHERRDADRFLQELAPSFRIAFDPDGTLAEQFHVRGMPTSFLIDRAGKIQSQHAGFRARDRDELAARIRTLVSTH